MSGYLHELACLGPDDCHCAVLYPVTETERMSDNERAEIAAKLHRVESRGPAGVLSHIGRALRTTGDRP